MRVRAAVKQEALIKSDQILPPYQRFIVIYTRGHATSGVYAEFLVSRYHGYPYLYVTAEAIRNTTVT